VLESQAKLSSGKTRNAILCEGKILFYLFESLVLLNEFHSSSFKVLKLLYRHRYFGIFH